MKTKKSKTIKVLARGILYVAKKHTVLPRVHSLFIGKEEDKLLYIYIYICVCVCVCVCAQQRNIRERCVTIKRIFQLLKLLKD